MMAVLRVQDSGTIPRPAEDSAALAIEGTVAPGLSEPPPETVGIGLDFVIIISAIAAIIGGYTMYRGSLSWLVKQNRPYDSAKRWAGLMAALGALGAAGLAILLINQAAAALGTNAG